MRPADAIGAVPTEKCYQEIATGNGTQTDGMDIPTVRRPRIRRVLKWGGMRLSLSFTGPLAFRGWFELSRTDVGICRFCNPGRLILYSAHVNPSDHQPALNLERTRSRWLTNG